MRGSAASEEAWSIGLRSFIIPFSGLEPWRRADRSMRERRDLEQLAHGGPVVADKPRQSPVDVGIASRLGLEGRRALFDAETPQELRLLDRTESGDTHCLDRPHQRLEIDMGGEIETARRSQRVGISMLADRLECLAQPRLDMTIIDDEGGAFVVGNALAELHAHCVAAPFEDRARAR